MDFWKFMRLSKLIAVSLLFSVAVVAQRDSPDFNRASTYDAQHYVIRVSFDRAKKRVFGDTTVSLKPLKSGFRQFELDAAGLNFESVVLDPNGQSLQFKAFASKIAIILDRAYSSDETVSVRLKYTATPKKGVYFIPDLVENGKIIRTAQIWTQGEPEDNRYWFPSFDFPSDKATSEEFITAEKDETVIGNGELVEQIDNKDGTVTWHYKMPMPHATYLVSFVIGKYLTTEDKYRDIPLGFYVYPDRAYIIKPAFGQTRAIMQAYESLTGVTFPFNKYDQTIVSGFQEFSGMENITATTLADTDVFFANFDFGKATVEDLVSHEMAHSWFGNLVTCKNWAELWLNEGFATYMEAASREKLYGRDSYLRKLRSDVDMFVAEDTVSRKRHGLFNKLAKPDNSLFDGTTYQKGGAVLHMLRETVGTESFWKGVNIYLNRHKFGNVETEDLKNAMEEASGKDLDAFFKQWVYSAGYPKLNLAQTYDTKAKMLRITIEQMQKADKITPMAFRLSLDLEIDTGSGKRIEKIELKKRFETFSFKIDKRPTGLKLDPFEKVILKMVKMAPLLK